MIHNNKNRIQENKHERSLKLAVAKSFIYTIMFAIAFFTIFIVLSKPVVSVELEKLTYEVNEPILIHTTPGSKSIVINCGDDHYRYLDAIPPAIAYRSNKAIICSIEEEVAGTTTSVTFTVINTSIEEMNQNLQKNIFFPTTKYNNNGASNSTYSNNSNNNNNNNYNNNNNNNLNNGRINNNATNNLTTANSTVNYTNGDDNNNNNINSYFNNSFVDNGFDNTTFQNNQSLNGVQSESFQITSENIIQTIILPRQTGKKSAQRVLESDEFPLQQINKNIRVTTSMGTGWDADVVIKNKNARFNAKTVDLGPSIPNNMMENVNGVPNGNEKSDVDITFKNRHITKISLRQASLSNSLDVGVDELDASQIDSPKNLQWTNVYAFDPANTTFADGTLSAVANGNELYKCRDWNFTTRTCDGDWVKLQDIIPGQSYDVALSTNDPGFAESVPNIGIDQSSTQSAIKIGGTIPTTFENVAAARWMATVFNPTNNTINVTKVQFIASTTIFATATGAIPATGWTSTTSMINWTGNVSVSARNATEFAVLVTSANSAIANAYVTINATTSAGNLTSDGYITHCSNTAIPYPALSLIYNNQQTSIVDNVSQDASTTYTVRVNNSGGGGAIPLGNTLLISIPPAWTNVSAPAQTGWLLGTIEGNFGSGWILMPQIASTTIAAAGTRDFVFSANPPSETNISLHTFTTRFFGPEGTATTRTIMSTLEPAIRVMNGTPVLSLQDNRYQEIRTGGGDNVLEQYVGIPAPFDYGGNQNYMGVTVVNPASNPINVTQIDVTADANLFGAITGRKPATTWTQLSGSQIRWNGTVTVQPRSAEEFFYTLVANGTANTLGTITITTATTNGTLTTSGWRSSYTTGTTPFVSIHAFNSTNGATFIFANVTANSNKTFVMCLNNSGASGVLPINMLLEIRIPPGWKNITVPAQGNWTLKQILQDDLGGSRIRAFSSGTTLAANTVRNFNFSAIAPSVGANSTYRFDALLIGPTGLLATQSERSVTQFAVRVVPNGTLAGINASFISNNISNMSSVAVLYIHSISKASSATPFTLSVFNTQTKAYDVIKTAVMGTNDEDWNITYTINRTFNPQAYIENNSALSTYGQAIVRWNTSSQEMISLLENLLEINATLDTTPPSVLLNYPQNNTYSNTSSNIFSYNSTDNYDLTNCTLYVNSSLQIANVTPSNSTNNFTATIADGIYNWSVGCYDLVKLYNTTSNKTITIDTTYPNIAILLPANNTKSTSQPTTFNYTPYDKNIANCSLYIDGIFNSSNNTLSNGVQSSFIATLNDGNHTWYISCTDLALNTYQNATRNISVDSTPPSPSSPTTQPNTNSVYNASQQYAFNATWTDLNNVDTVIFESNFSGILSNSSVGTHIGSIYSYAQNSLGAGNYVWRMYANDTFGNWGVLAQQTYILQKANSAINLYLNGTQSNYAVAPNESVNITAILGVPATGYMQIYSNGTLIADGNNFLQNITSFSINGTKNITAIYPATQNYNSSFMTLSIVVGDRNGPNATLIFPAKNTFTNNINISFKFYVVDETGTDSCQLYINNTLNTTLAGVVNLQNNTINVSGFTPGNYSYYLSCNDTIINRANSSTAYFAIDTTAPTPFSLVAPNNSTISNNQTPTFSWSQSSDQYFSNYTIIIDNANDFSSPNFINYTAGATNASIKFWNAFTSGIWYWKVQGYDLAGNYYETSPFAYNLDISAPIISPITQNNTYTNTSTNTIYYSANDANIVPNCTLNFNDSTSTINATINNSGTNNFSITKPDGEYLWNITCYDIAGNYNTSPNYKYIIDTVPPTSASLLAPLNNTFTNNNTPTLSWSQTTEPHFSNYTILVSDNISFPYTNFTYNTYLISSTNYITISPWPDGLWFWKIVVWDLAGNSVDPIFYYAIDSTPPSDFDLSTPANGTSSANSQPTLSWSQSNDINFANYTILLSDNPSFSYINRTYATYDSANTSFDILIALPMNVIWYWKVIAYDNATNKKNSTSIFSYITDNSPPLVSLVSPTNNNRYSSNTSSLITFIFNVTDLSDIGICTLYVTGSDTITDDKLFIAKNANQSFVETLSSGNYNWSVNCTDDASNVGSSITYNLSVNVSLPKRRWYDTAQYNNPQTSALANWTAMSVYANSTGAGVNPVSKYRLWNGTNWSAEGSLPNSSSPIRWIKLASSPILGRANEKIVVSVSDDGWLDAYVWNGTDWSAYNNLASVGTTSNAYRAFDVAYETQRGRAILAYGINSTNTSRDLAYRIWNGSDWNPEYYINDPSTNADSTIGFVRLASNPNSSSNELALAFVDITNADGKAMIWDGNNWASPANITTSLSSTAYEDVGVAYEQKSYNILAVAGTGSTVAYSSYNRTVWNLTSTVDINPSAAVNTEWLTLKPNPNGNQIMITGDDVGNDFSTALWSNGAWSGQLRHDATVDGNAQRVGDFDWEQTGDKGILVWGTTSGQLAYKTYSILSSWSAQNNLATGANIHSWVTVNRNPNNATADVKDLVVAQEANTFQLDGGRWDGATPLVDQSGAFTTSQNALTYQAFDLSYNNFAPITGTVNNVSLNASMDGNTNLITSTSSGLAIITNATTPNMGNYSALGLFMPKGSSITFSALLSIMNANVSYLTWAAYKTNSSNETLLCKNGDYSRNSSTSTLLDATQKIYTANCVLQNDTMFGTIDSIRVYLYSNSSQQNTITKYVDYNATYTDIDGFMLGNLSVNIISPTIDPGAGEGENFTLNCNTTCTNGYCMSTYVSAEINSTPYPSPAFAPIDYFIGNILLNSSSTNPAIIGNINSSNINNFSLQGNFYSFNNTILCSATSDYSNATSAGINISIKDKVPPNIILINPSGDGAYDPGIFTFTYNASDRRLGLCSLWGNWSGVWKLNQTMSPNNGTYSSFISTNISNYGVYKWNINCSDLAGNDAYSLANYTFYVAGDVYLNSSDITFSPQNPAEGANVTIFANIWNKANRNETNVLVAFYIGDPTLGGVQIGNNITIPLLQNLSNTTINTSLILNLGITNIFVVVDPPYGSGNIIESNETNNMANNTVQVSIWQTYYGNTTGNTTLDNYNNNTFSHWLMFNATGNIYVSDSDTTNGINFLMLRPLGRNTTNGVNPNTQNDFSELDTLLSTSSYADNVNNSFSLNGTPKAYESFKIYGTTWNTVPVINSTPDGNFTTGVMWDVDDSTNSYFDVGDKEDVVFVTKIKDNTLSIYGIVNYAIKIPSLLKNYKGTNPTVTIYYEIQ